MENKCEYERGQEDLIKQIKRQLSDVVIEYADKGNEQDFLLDILSILYNLKPIPNEGQESDKRH